LNQHPWEIQHPSGNALANTVVPRQVISLDLSAKGGHLRKTKGGKGRKMTKDLGHLISFDVFV